MRWIICCISLVCMVAVPMSGADSRSSPATQPGDQLGGQISAAISVPYRLTDTNHILIRVKVNGKGPFNFIMDTGAPAMFLRVPAAEKLGLDVGDGGLTTLDKLEVEGGVSLKHVQCIVETPYQIEGMNAIGATGVDLDGLLGYAILARFRLQIDLTKDHMLWTPINFSPPPLNKGRGPRPTFTDEDPIDQKEANLESMGAILKFLGPLVKPTTFPSKYRGFVGVELTGAGSNVAVSRVLGGSPADKAGVEAGDVLESVNGKAIRSIAAAQNAMARTFAGQPASLVIHRQNAVLKMNLICTEGL